MTGLLAAKVEWQRDEKGQFKMVEVPGSEFELPADLVVLAMGFEHVVHEGMVDAFGVDYSSRGNIAVDDQHMTSVPGVFATGDAKRGASLVVWAIQEGREAAQGIDVYLSRSSLQPMSEAQATIV